MKLKLKRKPKNNNVTLLQGDCLEVMKQIPDKKIQCCVTSPPYFGLRDYGCEDQIGLEQTPIEYINKLVDVFREVKRILRDDGTIWLNLGDSYYNYRPGKGQKLPKQSLANNKQDLPEVCSRRGNKLIGLKEKDLIGIPWRVAFALQSDGWYLRQDIIWHKPNPMPESVKDRCTKAHEYIFLLSKNPKYYFDNDAIKEPTVTKDNSNRQRDATKLNNTTGRTRMGGLVKNDYDFKNKRSVWTVTTKPFKGAHFAVFPTNLIEPCILAGCPEEGVVLDPFMGSGTTGVVALKHNRKFIGCELNSDYINIARNRINETKIKEESKT